MISEQTAQSLFTLVLLGGLFTGCSGGSTAALDAGDRDGASQGPIDGGSTTAPTALSLTATPASVGVDETATVSWSATADICRYDPQTALPVPLTNWPARGDACNGAQACAQAHSIDVTLPSSGTYTFGLTCSSAATPAHGEEIVSKTATVTVTGAPPIASCATGPASLAGLTRQTTGDLSDATANPVLRGVDETTWSHVFGILWRPRLSYYYAWPGIRNVTAKLTIAKDHYIALQFTVPADYPISDSNSYVPFGGFATNASNVSNGVRWALSITTECGDFMQPAPGRPDYNCYSEYSNSQGGGLNWVISDPAAPVADVCNLHPGQTYFMNFIAAPLNHPTQSNCTTPFCRGNFQQRGMFTNGDLIP